MAANLLSIINDSLYDIGGDVITTLGNNRQGLVASRCFRDAVINVCGHASWSWMKAIIAAESWANEVATISPNAVEVLMVRVGNRKIGAISDDDMYGGQRELTPYLTGSSSFPMYYAKVGHREYAFNSYPNDTTSRDAVRFHVRMLPSITLADDFEPAIPADVLILVRYYMSALLAMKLTGESNISQNFMQLYQENLIQTQSRYTFENSANSDAIW